MDVDFRLFETWEENISRFLQVLCSFFCKVNKFLVTKITKITLFVLPTADYNPLSPLGA
jgi:hypothetical protein